MKLRHILALAFAASFANAFAATPAAAPSGSTALCKDGTYFSGAQKQGACRGHKGIKDWYGEASAKKDEPVAAKTTAAAPAATASPQHSPPKPAAVAAAGGGAGKVWANDSTKVYHCQSDRWYGKTKEGEYMSESDAKAKGFKAARGKTCS